MSRFLCLAALVLLASATFAGEPAHEFLRFVEDAQGASLQTSIVHFQSPAGVKVDLVGAVHIADKPYYDELNRRFIQYDAVLYELVGGPMPAEKNGETAAERKVDPRLAWLGQMQSTMRKTLQLTGQLEGINYHARNFVHADMSTEQFYEAKEEKKESFLGLLVKAWKLEMNATTPEKEAKQPGLVKLMEILCRKDNASELKRLIGREFDSMEELIAGMESGGGTVIVGERNRVALEQMDKEIARGRHHIAIFYGAAHLADMGKKLEARGWKRDGIEWLKAWTLPPEPKEPPVR